MKQITITTGRGLLGMAKRTIISNVLDIPSTNLSMEDLITILEILKEDYNKKS